MNYEKNANKHYEYIVSAAKSHKNAGNDLYYDAWLLYALCKYFSVCGKPAAYSEQIEKAVLAPCEGMVRRVLKSADFKKTRVMVPVEEGELIVELAPVPKRCPECGSAVADEKANFCPHCGFKL